MPSVNMCLWAIPVFVDSTRAMFRHVFTQNFMALVPLSLVLGDITEDLGLRFGDTVGGQYSHGSGISAGSWKGRCYMAFV